MSTKFKKIENAETKQAEWMLEITCASTGTKQPEIGDIITVKTSTGGKRVVKLTDIVTINGTPSTYGCITIARFQNH